MNSKNKYDDIIHLPHHVSAKRVPMPIADRAAQFAPFAALTGFEATIQETGRLTDERIELDEGGKALLNEKLLVIGDAVDARPLVTFTCFRSDERKAGGAYVRITGRVKRIDENGQTVVLMDGTELPIPEIYEIDSDLFRSAC